MPRREGIWTLVSLYPILRPSPQGIPRAGSLSSSSSGFGRQTDISGCSQGKGTLSPAPGAPSPHGSGQPQPPALETAVLRSPLSSQPPPSFHYLPTQPHLTEKEKGPLEFGEQMLGDLTSPGRHAAEPRKWIPVLGLRGELSSPAG